jgi:hypothetical protein
MTDADRLKALKAVLQRGKTITDYARTEGVTAQAIYDWLNRRPDYNNQIAMYRRGQRAPIVGVEFWARVEAVRKRRLGMTWKQAGRHLKINDAALRQWVRINREQIDAALAELNRGKAA